MYTFTDYLKSKNLFESDDMRSSKAFKTLEKICKKYNVELKKCLKYYKDNLPTIDITSVNKDLSEKINIIFDNSGKKDIKECFNVVCASLNESDPKNIIKFTNGLASVANCISEIIEICHQLNDDDYYFEN